MAKSPLSDDDLTAVTADTQLSRAAQKAPLQSMESLEQEIARIKALPGRRAAQVGLFGQKLALDAIPGYHIHWFKDEGDRIKQHLDLGWTHITGTDGQPLRRSLGPGREGPSLMGYAMKIPLVFWKEEQDRRHALATAKTQAVKDRPFAAAPGSTQASDRGKFYDPNEGSGQGPVRISQG